MTTTPCNPRTSSVFAVSIRGQEGEDDKVRLVRATTNGAAYAHVAASLICTVWLPDADEVRDLGADGVTIEDSE